MKMKNILISENTYKSDDLYSVVYKNSKIINYLLSKNVDPKEIHPDSLASCYVDYYFSQVNGAGLSKFVHASGWDTAMLDSIEHGLRSMKAENHLEWFVNKRKEVNETISEEKMEEYVELDYAVDDPIRIQLDEDKEFYFIKDEIIDLNGQWLKDHKDTVVLSMDDIFVKLEEIVGEPIEQ
jgi:hypothetical protein